MNVRWLAHRRTTAKKGIGPIAFLLVLFIALLLASTTTSMVRVGLFRSLDVVEAYWTVSDQRVERAKVGEHVTGHVTVLSREMFEGDIVVRIRIDVRLWIDKDVVTQRFQVTLRSGESEEFRLDFMPTWASAGDINGYFIEVEFGFSRGRWTMPDYYPPRLIVTI